MQARAMDLEYKMLYQKLRISYDKQAKKFSHQQEESARLRSREAMLLKEIEHLKRSLKALSDERRSLRKKALSQQDKIGKMEMKILSVGDGNGCVICVTKPNGSLPLLILTSFPAAPSLRRETER